MCLYRQWWEQPTLDIMGIKTGQVAAEGGGDMGGRIRVGGRLRVG